MQTIKAGTQEIQVVSIYGQSKYIDGLLRQTLSLTLPPGILLTPEQLAALSSEDWEVYEEDGTLASTQEGYVDLQPLQFEFARVDTSAKQIVELRNELEEANNEIAVTAAVIPALLRGATREKAMPLAEYIPDWAPGPFEEGDIRKDEGQIYQLIAGKAHDATNQPDWRPSQQPSLWFLWHGISRETAMPFVPVTGAHDMYRKGEWMILEDEYYEAIEDTAYSPKDYAGAWKKG